MPTYVNNLRLTELNTGEGSGTWGTTTNTSLELIGEALGFNTQDCFSSDADATTTVADGATDPARALYFKVTSSATLSATRTLTIAPNTVSRVMFIENATTGSQSINISQGSGANVTIATGKTAVVYLDGAGSGAAVVDAMAGVDPGVTDTLAEVLAAGNVTSGANLQMTTTDELQFRDTALKISSSTDGQLDIDADTELEITAPTVDINASTAVLVSNDLKLDSDSAVLGFGADNDTTLTHTDGSGLTLNSTNKIMFNDASQFIQGSSATVLSLGATDEIDLTATAIDVNGTMDVSGALTGSTATLSSSTASDVQLTLTNTDAGSSFSPSLDLHRNSSSPADDDQLGRIRFRGENDASENTIFASISVLATDVTDGTEDGTLRLITKKDGTDGQRLIISSSETVFNENSQDVDFRVESDGSTHALFLQASDGNVGFNKSSPSMGIDLVAANNSQLRIDSSDTNDTTLFMDYNGGGATNRIRLRNAAGAFAINVANTSEAMRINSSGNVGFGTTSPANTVHVKTDTDGNGITIQRNSTTENTFGQLGFSASTNDSGTPNLFIRGYRGSSFTDNFLTFGTGGSSGGTERLRIDSSGNVGIGTTSPARALEVNSGSIDIVALLTSTDANSTLAFWDGSGGAAITNASGELALRTNGSSSNGSATTERVRIDSSGNVGIGTTSPATALDVTGVITTDGLTTSADINFGDDDKAVFGAGSDLLIFHDGSDSHIRDQGTGNLIIRGNNLSLQSFGAASYLEAAVSGAVELYHNGNKKLETNSSGIDVTGTAVTDGLTVDGTATITTANNTAQLTLKSTDTDSSVGPRLDMIRDSASPADNDLAGQIRFLGDNDAGEQVSYAFIRAKLLDVSDGAEDGQFDFTVKKAGVDRSRIKIQDTETVINEDQVDLNFRVESDGSSHMLFVDAGNNRVGIGSSSPDELLHLTSTTASVIRLERNDTTISSGNTIGNIEFEHQESGGAGLCANFAVKADTSAGAGAFVFETGSAGTLSEVARLDSSGNFLVAKTVTSLGTVGIALKSNGAIFATVDDERPLILNRETAVGTIAEFRKDNGIVGSISVSASATTYNTSSDARLKRNIADADEAGSLIDAIQVRKFDWIEDGVHQDYGMVAQELETVVPDAVSTGETEEDMMGVDYSKLVPMMMKEIQSLRARVAQLEGDN